MFIYISLSYGALKKIINHQPPFMKSNILLLAVFLALFSCKEKSINNEKYGKLKSEYNLIKSGLKTFELDSITATRIKYSQTFYDNNGKLILTFMNGFDNSIYLYDFYGSKNFFKKIKFEKSGANSVKMMGGYYFHSIDSLLIFDKIGYSIKFSDSIGNISETKIDIASEEESKDKAYFLKYPVYDFTTANSIKKYKDNLLLTGMYPWAINDTMIDKFNITVKINLIDSSQKKHMHTYPQDIYGEGFYWGDPIFTYAYSALSPDSKNIIYSFPVSHDLYIANLEDSSISKIFAGSNTAKDFNAIDKKFSDKRNNMTNYYLNNDLYANILFDEYREIYYRFVLRHIENESYTAISDKNLGVILMDNNFNYLGESTIGSISEYHWENAFITKDGLNIEYLDDKDLKEKFLKFRTFVPKKIEQ